MGMDLLQIVEEITFGLMKIYDSILTKVWKILVVRFIILILFDFDHSAGFGSRKSFCEAT
jgi:hypothetical protein